MGQEGLQLFGGDWTEQKLDAVEQYLSAYRKVLSKQPYRVVYIDAFAGTGYREQKQKRQPDYGSVFGGDGDLAAEEPQRFLDGSARIALKTKPSFDHYIFVELNADRAAELEKLKGEFAPQAGAIDIRCGEANATVQAICSNWDPRNERGVLFLDPFGMQLEWSTVEAVARTRSIDVWILFPFAVNRLLTRYPHEIPPEWRNRLNHMFGTTDWEKRFYKERVIENIFSGSETVVEKSLTFDGLAAYYQERLKGAFPVVAPNPRVLRNTRQQPLFQLYFAAANPGKGGAIAVKIAEHILKNI